MIHLTRLEMAQAALDYAEHHAESDKRFVSLVAQYQAVVRYYSSVAHGSELLSPEEEWQLDAKCKADCAAIRADQADDRKPERGFYRGKDWLAVPAFNRFSAPMWQLKCRYAYDNAQEWEGGYTACDTLEDAVKAAKRRIDGVVEREAAERELAEIQTAPVIVGKQLTAFEVEHDPRQMDMFK